MCSGVFEMTDRRCIADALVSSRGLVWSRWAWTACTTASGS